MSTFFRHLLIYSAIFFYFRLYFRLSAAKIDFTVNKILKTLVKTLTFYFNVPIIFGIDFCVNKGNLRI